MKAAWIKKCVALCLAAVLAVPCMGAETAQAENAFLSSTKMTIGIGSYGIDSPVCSKTETRYTLSVANAKKGASYMFTSSDKKILTVKSKGKNCYITGVKAGKATVKVTQKLKGKTTNVGTCKVTVKNASLVKHQTDSYGVGGGPTFVSDSHGIVAIKNLNPDAKYTFKTNSSDLTITQSLENAQQYVGFPGKFKCVIQKFRAKKGGTYKVTVKETYKNKTRTLGTVKVVIDSLKVPQSLTMYTGLTKTAEYELSTEPLYIGGYVENVIEDTSIVSCTANEGYDDNHTLTALKAGTTKWSVYAINDDKTRGDLLGECEITVKDPVVEEISFDYANEGVLDFYLSDGESVLYYTINMEGGYYSSDFGDTIDSQVKITSSDDSIISIVKNKAEEYCAKPVKEGKAQITISCGDVSATVDAVVYDEDSDYDEDYDEDYDDEEDYE